jgi:subtilase family serine protease
MHIRSWQAAGLVLALTGCTDKAGDSGGDVNLYVSYAGCYVNGGSVDCDIAVENLGADPSGSFKVGVYVNHGGDPSPGDSASGQATISSIEPGGTGSATVTVSAGASDTLWILADMTDVVAETDEGDNVQGPLSPTQRR